MATPVVAEETPTPETPAELSVAGLSDEVFQTTDETPAAEEGTPPTPETTIEETPATEAPPAETTPETPPATPEVKPLPEWSKPLQQQQQEVANLRRDMGEIKSLLTQIAAGKATPAQQQQVQQATDTLATLEQSLAGDFDPYAATPALIKGLIAEVRSTRQQAQQAQQAMAQLQQSQSQQASASTYWATFATEHPGVDGPALWRQAQEAALADAELTTPEQQFGAAKAIFKQAVTTAKTAPAKPVPPVKPAPTPVKPAPVTTGGSGGRVVPTGAAVVRQTPSGPRSTEKLHEDFPGLSDEFD